MKASALAPQRDGALAGYPELEKDHHRNRPGSVGLKRVFRALLRDEIELRNGRAVSRPFKSEAVLRRLMIGAIREDAASLAALLVVAEATEEFHERYDNSNKAAVLLRWLCDSSSPNPDRPIIPRDQRS